MIKYLKQYYRSQWYLFNNFILYIIVIIIYNVVNHFSLELKANLTILTQLTIITEVFYLTLFSYIHNLKLFLASSTSLIIILMQLNAVSQHFKLHQVFAVYVIYGFIQLLLALAFDKNSALYNK